MLSDWKASGMGREGEKLTTEQIIARLTAKPRKVSRSSSLYVSLLHFPAPYPPPLYLSNACPPPSLNNTTSDHLPNEQTNYLSHFYLTCLLLPTLLSSALSSPANTIRIVNVSSDGHAKLAPKEGIDFTSPAFPKFETSSTWTRYGISKLAQVLHSKEIARRYGEQGIISVSLHPGTVKTNLSNGPRGTTPWYKFIQPLIVGPCSH